MLFSDKTVNPANQIHVIRRFLHVIGLLQNPSDQDEWNGTSISDLLSMDTFEISSPDSQVSPKNVQDYIDKKLIKELKLNIRKQKGGKRIELDNIDEKLMIELVNIYSLFVVHDSARESILRRFAEKHKLDCLWMMARVYFASITGRMISFRYESRLSNEMKEYIIKPYYMVMRGNNFYLAGENAEKRRNVLFIFSKIAEKSLKVLDVNFDAENKPSLEELFAGSIGAYIGTKKHVKLRYSRKAAEYVEEIIDSINPEIKKIEGNGKYAYEAEFDVADDIYLCKQLITWGSETEIISPIELREKMKSMLESCLKNY
ncbi:MAG TPA: WYL domain-containing protein [Spirochaetota bacterium]|nr:WYL domain-containing protein [Spirochaetota bacterium]